MCVFLELLCSTVPVVVPLKPPPPPLLLSFLLSPPPLNLQTVQATIFGQSPHILDFCETLTPSHLLKVTAFSVKISQCKFLVMTKKHFCLLTLVYFLCKNSPPPPPLKKVTSLFPSNPHLKIEILSRPPPFENFTRGSTPLSSPSRKGGGGGGGGGAVHTMFEEVFSCIVNFRF